MIRCARLRLRHSLVLPLLLTSLLGQAAALFAAETPESVNALLKAGKEVAWVIEDTVNSEDKNLAIVFTVRAKDAKPGDFPVIVRGSDGPVPNLTNATESNNSDDYIHTLENAVVHLGDKRILCRLPAQAYFPGQNKHYLDVFWRPQADGQILCLLLYGFRWWTFDVICVETGPGFRQTSIDSYLDAATQQFLSSGAMDLKGFPADSFGILYQSPSFLKRDAKSKTDGPVMLKFNFTAAIPKDENAPSLEGTVTVRLEAREKELGAKVLKVEPAKAK